MDLYGESLESVLDFLKILYTFKTKNKEWKNNYKYKQKEQSLIKLLLKCYYSNQNFSANGPF